MTWFRAGFLRQKESNMRQIVGRAYTELGKELYEAQQKLARQGSKYDGVFEKWYTAIGFKRQRVYDLINRYNLLRNSEEVSEIELIEDLPVSLTYEIAKPSAESTPAKTQAKSEVLSGVNLINGFECIYNSRGMYLRDKVIIYPF